VLQTNKVDSQSGKLAIESNYVDNVCVKVANFQLPYLHLAPPLGVTSFEFCRDFRHQKTRVLGQSCGVVHMILRLAVSVEH